MTECGQQDVVLLALKAHQIVPVVDALKTLLGPDTVMVALQNGIPWWYFQGNGGEYENRIVETVDPGGILANSIDPKCIIGCIAYPAATIAEPGVIQHVEGDRFPVGELDNSESDRLNMVSELFTVAGFKSRVLTDIRSEIWLKLWGNLTFNPISALSHSTLVDICQYPKTRELATTMMTEAQQIAERLGASFRVTIERRIDGAESVGKHKTSMLQDVEAGKPLEIDGMLGVVIDQGASARTVVDLSKLPGAITETGWLGADYGNMQAKTILFHNEWKLIHICFSSSVLFVSKIPTRVSRSGLRPHPRHNRAVRNRTVNVI